MTARWTKRNLLREMMATLRDEKTSLIPRDIPSEADHKGLLIYEDRPGHTPYVRIYIDVTVLGSLQVVIHELLHYIMRKEVGKVFSGEIEEEIVKALQRHIEDHLDVNPYLLERWRRAIARKLPKVTA